MKTKAQLRERDNLRMANWRAANRDRNIEARRRSYLWWAYGLELEDYDKLSVAQGHVCAICKNPEQGRGKEGNLKYLAVDHCHATGVIRGLLCERCNHALGNFNDNVANIRVAVTYLECANTGLIAERSKRYTLSEEDEQFLDDLLK